MSGFLRLHERMWHCRVLELIMKNKFLTWYRLTHWGYREEWLAYDEGRFLNPETQAMFIAYRAGYNRHKKESKIVT